MSSKKKINYKIVILGITLLLSFFLVFYYSWTDRNIRLNGNVIKAPIVEFYGRLSRPNGSVSVRIDGVILNAGKFDRRGYSLGDSIEVCYIPNEYCVVQKRVNPNRYYLYFALESIILLVGGYLIISGLRGQGFEKVEEKAPFVKSLKRNRKRSVKKFK